MESSSLEPRSILIKCDASGVILKLVRRTFVGNAKIVTVPQEHSSSKQHAVLMILQIVTG